MWPDMLHMLNADLLPSPICCHLPLGNTAVNVVCGYKARRGL
uniref:Uncharacterized protein n=1 Tax=Rhizophora mucronata TaxID=61149 RepID=A0A2P2QJ08_RHIMU